MNYMNEMVSHFLASDAAAAVPLTAQERERLDALTEKARGGLVGRERGEYMRLSARRNAR